jgi:hypothetical protein
MNFDLSLVGVPVRSVSQIHRTTLDPKSLPVLLLSECIRIKTGQLRNYDPVMVANSLLTICARKGMYATTSVAELGDEMQQQVGRFGPNLGPIIDSGVRHLVQDGYVSVLRYKGEIYLEPLQKLSTLLPSCVVINNAAAV